MVYKIMRHEIGQPKTSDTEYKKYLYEFDKLPDAITCIDTLNKLLSASEKNKIIRFYIKEV